MSAASRPLPKASKTPNGLIRQLTNTQMIALAIAGIGPFYSIFVVYGSIAQAVGTGILWLFFGAGIVAVANGLVFSHLSRYYPLAGGGYALVRQILGPAVGAMYVILSILNWVLVVAAFTGPAATFINTIHPIMSPTMLQILLILIMVLLSIGNVRLSGVVSVVFLILELCFTAFWIILGFTHLQLPWSTVMEWPRALSAHAIGQPIGILAFVSAIPLAIYSLAGYESSIHYTEEMLNFKKIVTTVTVSAVGAALLYMIAMPLVLLTDHHFGLVMNAAIPGESAMIHAVHGIAPLFLLYLAISSFNGGLVSYQEASRMLMNAANDGNFGIWLKHVLGRVTQRGVPWVATLIWFVPTVLVVLIANLSTILSFTGVTIMVTYIIVAIAAIWFKAKTSKQFDLHGGAFWVFPLVPLFVIAASVVVIILQPKSYIAISVGILVAGALIGWAAFKRFRFTSTEELIQNSLRAQGELQ
ncbi:MAG: hypothetical protein C7B46_13030 [Sulfobacillus benefaciens]|uniref:APC family permease n=1 Tax=Sulfobacillus benefaciens TaxID=453960 RepID=A0A2T2XDV6_9FIRM|nr:MAG: hypothetical protein C7B46_13030 [Sulfobacillus benefaciens]